LLASDQVIEQFLLYLDAFIKAAAINRRFNTANVVFRGLKAACFAGDCFANIGEDFGLAFGFINSLIFVADAY
jgi:hypothetical protein